MPWNITTLKYESNKRILSAEMDATSSNAGEGSELNEYDINEGWIMTAAFVMLSRLSIIRK